MGQARHEIDELQLEVRLDNTLAGHLLIPYASRHG